MKIDLVPVIDLSVAQDSVQLGHILAAAHDVGVFYVTGHGIPQPPTPGILDMARRLLALPAEQLREIDNVQSPQSRGYSRVGAEQTGGRPDWREQFDVGSERQRREIGATVLEPLVARHNVIAVITHRRDFGGLGEDHLETLAGRLGLPTCSPATPTSPG